MSTASLLQRQQPVCLLLLLLSGCAQDSESRASTSEPDLEVAVAELEIGAMDGTGPDVFSRITGLTSDDSGRIFVLDYASAEVRVFGPEGGHLFTFGGIGSGPGKLNGPCCLTRGPDGLLWVRDGGNSRYSAFAVADSSAEFVETRRMAHTDFNYLVPIRFTPDGDLIDIGKHPAPDGGFPITLFTLSEASEAVEVTALDDPPPDQIGMHTIRDGGSVWYFHQPFGPRRLLAFGPGGDRASGIGSNYAIEWVRGADTIRIESTAASPALTANERAEGQTRMESDAERAGIAVGAFPYGVPERKPPLQGIAFDEVGRLWVLLSRSEDAPQVAEIWSREGEMVGRVEMPADVLLGQPISLGERSGLAIRRDSLGVQSVVRLGY